MARSERFEPQSFGSMPDALIIPYKSIYCEPSNSPEMAYYSEMSPSLSLLSIN